MLPFCLMDSHCRDQQVATGRKELTKNGGLKAEAVVAMHITSLGTLLQKIMRIKAMARISNVGSQNPACKFKI